MSLSFASPSTESSDSQPVPIESTAPRNRLSPLNQDTNRPLSAAPTRSSLECHRKHLSVDGRELSYLRKPANGEPQSPTKAIHSAEQLRSRKLFPYIKTWRSNFVLTLDGGGVRGYSQLIILKALMDKVAELERTTLDEHGKPVESSFHPLTWEDVKQKKLSKPQTRANTPDPPNVKANGHANISENERGRQVSSDISLEESNHTQFYPYHYFDWIAGTSTGGLNAIMLGRLRMSVDECLKDYADLAEKVFGKPRWASYRFSPLFWFCAKYSGDRLRDVVKELVEQHVFEGEGYAFAMNKDMCRTVVVAIKKNIRSHEMAHLFRTYEHHRRRQAPAEDRDDFRPNPMERPAPADSSLIWQVALATSAAPTYFNTIKIGEDEYGDGGFGENNPSTRIFWEVSQMNHNLDEANALSLSIGTGISRFTRFQKGLLKRPIGWINAAKKVSTDCEKGHHDMNSITNGGRKYDYYRFNVPEKATDPDAPKLSRWEHVKASSKRWFGHGGEPLDRGLGKIKLDEWKQRGIWRKESTQEEMERITRDYIEDPVVDRELDAVAKAMVAHRRERAATPRWAAYALGVKYECPVTLERCPDETWTEESQLRRHLIEDHEFPTGTPDAEKRLDRMITAGKYFEAHH